MSDKFDATHPGCVSCVTIGEFAARSRRSSSRPHSITASFEWAYSRTGLSGAESTTFLLPRLIGLRRALELVLLNPRLEPARARDLGLITEVVPDGELDGTVMRTALALAQGPTAAWAAGICGLPAAQIEALARSLPGKRVLVVVAHSLQRAEHGEQPVWMGVVLAAALG